MPFYLTIVGKAAKISKDKVYDFSLGPFTSYQNAEAHAKSLGAILKNPNGSNFTVVQHQNAVSMISYGWGEFRVDQNSTKPKNSYVKVFDKQLSKSSIEQVKDIAANVFTYEGLDFDVNWIEKWLGKNIDEPVINALNLLEEIDPETVTLENATDLIRPVFNYMIAVGLRSKRLIDGLENFNRAVFNSLQRQGVKHEIDSRSSALRDFLKLIDRQTKIFDQRLNNEEWNASLKMSHYGRFWTSDIPFLSFDSSGKLLPPYSLEKASAFAFPLSSEGYIVLNRISFKRRLDEHYLNQCQAFQAERWIIGTTGAKPRPNKRFTPSSLQIFWNMDLQVKDEKYELAYLQKWESLSEIIDLPKAIFEQYLTFAKSDFNEFFNELYGEENVRFVSSPNREFSFTIDSTKARGKLLE